MRVTAQTINSRTFRIAPMMISIKLFLLCLIGIECSTLNSSAMLEPRLSGYHYDDSSRPPVRHFNRKSDKESESLHSGQYAPDSETYFESDSNMFMSQDLVSNSSRDCSQSFCISSDMDYSNSSSEQINTARISGWSISPPMQHKSGVFYSSIVDDHMPECPSDIFSPHSLKSQRDSSPNETQNIQSGGQSSTFILGYPYSNLLAKQYNTRREYRREIAFQETVSHSNIIRLFCKSDKRKSIVMDCAPYGDLGSSPNSRWLIMMKNTATKEKLEWLKSVSAQLVSAIRAIHNAGWLHHDIKPKNIVLFSQINEHPHVELIDFGLVARISEGGLRGRGTAGTMAPEVAGIYEPRGKMQEEIDWWSVGVTIYLLHTCSHESFSSSNRHLAGPYHYVSVSETDNRKRIIWHPIPKYFSPELVELLSILLNQNHLKRRIRTEEQFRALQKMKYFRGIEWDSISKRKT